MAQKEGKLVISDRLLGNRMGTWGKEIEQNFFYASAYYVVCCIS